MKKLFLTMSMVLAIIIMANAQDVFTACIKGDIKSVKKYAEHKKFKINQTNKATGQNLLAYSYMWPEITKYLLEKGCDPNGGAYPALVSASSVGSYEVIKMLVAKGADVNKRGGNELPLFKIVQMTNCAECAELLLSNGADVKTTGGVYENLFGVYGSYGLPQAERKTYMVNYSKTLQKYGLTIPEWYINPDATINAPSIDMVKVLKKYKIDINARSTSLNLGKKEGRGEPPLFTAMNIGKTEIILNLLNNGADYNATYAIAHNPYLTMWTVTGIMEYSPLMYAIIIKNKEVIKWLVAKEDLADAKVSGLSMNSGEDMIIRWIDLSAIYLALISGDDEMVKLTASSPIKWKDLTIKALPGQKFEGSHGGKDKFYTFNAMNKGQHTLRYTPSMFAGFLGNENMEKYLK
ncbi:ankyrin repeat domain-containing protein [Bacteroidota bacterium]